MNEVKGRRHETDGYKVHITVKQPRNKTGIGKFNPRYSSATATPSVALLSKDRVRECAWKVEMLRSNADNAMRWKGVTPRLAMEVTVGKG